LAEWFYATEYFSSVSLAFWDQRTYSAQKSNRHFSDYTSVICQITGIRKMGTKEDSH